MSRRKQNIYELWANGDSLVIMAADDLARHSKLLPGATLKWTVEAESLTDAISINRDRLHGTIQPPWHGPINSSGDGTGGNEFGSD